MSFVVKYVPVYVYNLGVFPSPVHVLVGLDEVCSLVGFETFSINAIPKFNNHHKGLMTLSRRVEKIASSLCVHGFL